MKLLCFASILLFISCFAVDDTTSTLQDHPCLDERMRVMIAPYLLPVTHPIKPIVDHLFSQSRVTETMLSLTDAGFEVIASMPRSFIVVARHRAVPGYVFKLYLDTEQRIKDKTPSWQWLVQRCIGASKLRTLIAQKKMKHFFVPDKWIYVLPEHPASQEAHPHPLIVIATDIEPESEAVSKEIWKTRATKEQLKELYDILQRGYSTTQIANIPYTKRGQFAFMDTEYPCRNLHVQHVGKYLSKEMERYWEKLIEKKGSP